MPHHRGLDRALRCVGLAASVIFLAVAGLMAVAAFAVMRTLPLIGQMAAELGAFIAQAMVTTAVAIVATVFALALSDGCDRASWLALAVANWARIAAAFFP